MVWWGGVAGEGTGGSAAGAGVEGGFGGGGEAAQEAARAIGRATDDGGGARPVIGYGLIGLGVVFLLHNLDWIRWPHWARVEVLWPLILVGSGVALAGRAMRKEAAGRAPPGGAWPR